MIGWRTGRYAGGPASRERRSAEDPDPGEAAHAGKPRHDDLVLPRAPFPDPDQARLDELESVEEPRDVLPGPRDRHAGLGLGVDPPAFLERPLVEVTAHLDFSEPVGLLLVSILHFLADETAYPVVAKLRDRLAPGSHLVIAHGSVGDLDEKRAEEGKQVYAKSSAGGIHPRSRAQIESFFEGLRLVEPGVVTVDEWRPREGEPVRTRTSGGVVYGGVGVVG